jgi:TfoX/Sxy family transcriptional regulator of competence genes
MIHQWSIFVSDPVGKLITNGMIIQKSTENSISKYKNSGSVYWIWIETKIIEIQSTEFERTELERKNWDNKP